MDVFGLEISASTPYAFMLQFILDLCFNLHTTHECFILHKYFYVADLSCIESFLFGEISKKLWPYALLFMLSHTIYILV